MNVPIEWQLVLEKKPNLKKLFLDQEKEDVYGEAPVPPYFFHYFRPNNYDAFKGLFVPFKNGKEMFKRIKEIYELTKEDYKPQLDGSFTYFKKERDKNITTEQIASLVLKCIQSLNMILKDYGQELRIREDDIEVHIMDKGTFDKMYDPDETLEADIWILVQEWDVQLEPDKEKNPLVFFNEALYQIAADYGVAKYISWPLKGRRDIEDPYKGYFDIWKLGYMLRIVNPECIILTY